MTEGNVTGQPMPVANPSDAFMEAKLDGERDGTVHVSGSKGPDFDSLDAVEQTRKEFVDAKNKRTDNIKDKPQDKIPGKENENHDGKSDGKSATKESKESKQESKEGAVDDKSQKTAEQKARKIIKALDGESILDIPHDANVPVKVDGKVIHVPVADLINNYSGKTSWDKKFSEVDRKEKQWLKEKEAIFTHFKEMKKHMDEKRPLDAFSYLVDTLGGDKHTFIKAMRDAFTPEILNLYNMTEEERQSYEVKSEAEALRERLQKTEAEKNRYAQEKETFLKVHGFKRNLGISDEQWGMASEALENLGHTNAEPELVRDYIVAQNAISRVDQIVAKIAPGVELPTEKSDKIVKFVMEDPAITDDDLEYVIRQATVLENRKLQTLTEKAPDQIQKPVHQTNKTSTRPEFFSDFED